MHVVAAFAQRWRGSRRRGTVVEWRSTVNVASPGASQQAQPCSACPPLECWARSRFTAAWFKITFRSDQGAAAGSSSSASAISATASQASSGTQGRSSEVSKRVLFRQTVVVDVVPAQLVVEAVERCQVVLGIVPTIDEAVVDLAGEGGIFLVAVGGVKSIDA